MECVTKEASSSIEGVFYTALLITSYVDSLNTLSYENHGWDEGR